jgi:YD repeat-containing protein
VTYAYGTADAGTVSYIYDDDGMGRVLTSTDQAGKTTTKTYDAVGRQLTVKGRHRERDPVFL